MGTRSTTTIKDEKGQTLVTMYRQFDGYLSGHGADLKQAFGQTKLINGYNDQKAGEYANGMGCFAAQVIAHFKDTIGGFYLVPEGQLEEWNYVLYPKDGRIWITVDESDTDCALSELSI